MLDESTGMQLGKRYRIESPLGDLLIDGFFLDGTFFDSDHHRAPLGWLEANNFIFNAVDGNGTPIYPNRIAGEIHNLVLTLADGKTLGIRHVGNG
jgi:hypothetical protein